MQKRTARALLLFSGGLDSILAAKVLEEQGIAVKCLHFVTPFFGGADAARHWSRVYGLDIDAVDISEDFIHMLAQWPPHGYGKVLNPCVDCKILLFSRARQLLSQYNADFLASGEVIGQRPMSQRKDALYLIRREADVKDLLLRPLCALQLDPTPFEEQGLVDRARLLGLSGRGRKDQLDLAVRYGLKEIPTPAGGCRLAEKENARRYWPVLCHVASPTPNDFLLADTGRHYRKGAFGLSIGRNSADNERLLSLRRDADITFKVADMPGPVAIARSYAGPWDNETLTDAAAFIASFSPRALALQAPVRVRASILKNTEPHPLDDIVVTAARVTPLNWSERPWPEVREEIRAKSKARQQQHGQDIDDGLL